MQSNLQPDQILQTYIDGIKQQKPTDEQDLKMEQKLFASIDNYAEAHNGQRHDFNACQQACYALYFLGK